MKAIKQPTDKANAFYECILKTVENSIQMSSLQWDDIADKNADLSATINANETEIRTHIENAIEALMFATSKETQYGG